jgi:hypothetical protein
MSRRKAGSPAKPAKHGKRVDGQADQRKCKNPFAMNLCSLAFYPANVRLMAILFPFSVGTNVVMVGHVGVGSHCSMLTSYSLRRVSDLLVRAKDLFAVAQG